MLAAASLIGRFSATGSYGMQSTTGADVSVGAGLVPGPARFFPGSIDDVRIYNRALSYQEIQQLWLMGK
jgi:concanavalin A-like lectin/glucanase superfamily protein